MTRENHASDAAKRSLSILDALRASGAIGGLSTSGLPRSPLGVGDNGHGLGTESAADSAGEAERGSTVTVIVSAVGSGMLI